MKQSLWYKACNFSDSKKRVHLRLGPQTNSIGNSRDKRSSTKTISFKCILVFVSADFHTFSDSSEKNLLERRQIAWKNVTRLKCFLQHTLLLKMEIACMLSRLGKKHFAFHVKKPRKKQVNNL